jgi:hypothetical protein
MFFSRSTAASCGGRLVSVISRKWRSGMLAIAALFGTVSHSQQLAADWRVVPGSRVGAITARTSDAALEALFGAANVQKTDVYLGEGFTAPGTVVYPNNPTRRLEIVWRDSARTAPKEVRLTGESSMWQTVEGISLGSTLREIERLNGWPFKLAGFAFDYVGTIVDCGRGRLAMLGCSGESASSPRRRLLVIRLRPGDDAARAPEYRQVMGDRVFSSGHPAMQALEPRVYQMIVSLDPGGGV